MATMAGTGTSSGGWSRWAIPLLGLAAALVVTLQLITPLHTINASVQLELSKQAFLMSQPEPSSSSPIATLAIPDYHIVFSSSCTPQQQWESWVFFYHAMKVQQPGNVTRIASGCSKKEAADLQLFHQQYIETMSSSFHLHLTPDFSRVRLSEGKHAYKYMNKPYGLRHWFEHGGLGLIENQTIPSPARDGIVMLLDPDMILLRPLLHDLTNQDVIWVDQARNKKPPATMVVRHGYPIAQQDGYLDNSWMKLNTSYITGQPEGSYQPVPAWQDGHRHWNTGPPYLATVADMYKIAVRWTEYAPRVLDIYPHLFAEMFGFIHATVQLQLPFTLIKSIVVSTTESKDREGWAYIDDIPDDQICDPLVSTHLPIGLHYCKRYFLGKSFFSKYRLKKNIMDCDKALLKPPPKDMVVKKIDYAVTPPRADLKETDTYIEERHPMNTKQGKREAFMLCGLVDALNEALIYHKLHACNGTETLNETYTVYDDPSNW